MRGERVLKFEGAALSCDFERDFAPLVRKMGRSHLRCANSHLDGKARAALRAADLSRSGNRAELIEELVEKLAIRTNEVSPHHSASYLDRSVESQHYVPFAGPYIWTRTVADFEFGGKRGFSHIAISHRW